MTNINSTENFLEARQKLDKELLVILSVGHALYKLHKEILVYEFTPTNTSVFLPSLPEAYKLVVDNRKWFSIHRIGGWALFQRSDAVLVCVRYGISPAIFNGVVKNLLSLGYQQITT